MSHSATFVQCHTHGTDRSWASSLHCNVTPCDIVQCHTHTANRSIFGFLSPLQCHTVRHLYTVTLTQLTDRSWASSLHCNVTPCNICTMSHTRNRSIFGFLSPLQCYTVRHLYNVTHTQLTDRSLAFSIHCNVTQCDICTMSHTHS